MLVHCPKCNIDYDNSVWEKCPYCGGNGVEIAETAKERETPLKEEKSKPSKKSVPPKKKRKSQDPFETMEDLLDEIIDEYGGEEIFCEENHFRLNKALMSLDETCEPEKDWLLIANMKRIPQKLYAVTNSTQSEKQEMVETCRDALISLTLDEEVCEKIVQAYMSILGINAEVRKKPVIEKNIKEEKVLIRYTASSYSFDQDKWIQKEFLYKTCIIGSQEWFAENFHEKYGRYKNGNWESLIGQDLSNKDFGRLYDWYEAVKNAPQGWRLPTIEDYQKLSAYIQSLNLDAGTVLKSTEHWIGTATAGTDLFGFCAYPTVNDSKTGESEAWFWTSSETGDNEYPHYCISIKENSDDVNLTSKAGNGYYACVRYVRDVE